MFFKNKNKVVYTPYGKSDQKVYKPNLYDDEKTNPFEEIAFTEESVNYSKNESFQPCEDIAKDDILEYILCEYS